MQIVTLLPCLCSAHGCCMYSTLDEHATLQVLLSKANLQCACQWHAALFSKEVAVQDGEGFAVPMSKHQVHQDQPEAVNNLVLQFLQQKVCHGKPSQQHKVKAEE